MSTNYLSFFNLTDNPFRLTPDISYFYNAPAHATALLSLEYCLTQQEGFCILTGEPGTGKTTILRLFTEKWKERAELALIMTPHLSPDEFFQAILDDFKIPLSPSKNDMLKSFRNFLLTHAANGRRVAIVIDEAQELPHETMEELRLLSNLETEKEKLLQIILIGQPELRDKLLSEPFRQLNQRISIRVQLNPLTEPETSDYINTRLIRGGNSSLLYTQKAKDLIYKFSGGIPRTINLLASRGLMSAFLCESKEVSDKHIEQGAADVLEPAAQAAEARSAAQESRRKSPWTPASDKITRKPAVRGIFVLAAGLIAVAAVGTLSYFKYNHRAIITPAAIAPTSAKAVLARVSSAALAPVSTAKRNSTATENPFHADMINEIAKADPHATALKSYNALAMAWNLPQVDALDKADLPPEKYLEKLFSKKGLDDITFYGTLDKFLALDYPAIIAIATSPTGKEIYTTLLKASGKEYVLSPLTAGRKTLTRKELESIWRGKAFVLWKNQDDIPRRMEPGAKGKELVALKRLLRNAGLHAGKNPVFDQYAVAALRKYQHSQGITITGQPDARTLIRLYGKSTTGFRPKLK